MFTVAETFSIALGLPSTLAAQAAHVIPRTKSSKRTSLDDSPGPGDRPLLNAADDMQRHIQAIPLVGKTSTECLPQLRGRPRRRLPLPGQRYRPARAAPENIHTPEQLGKITEKLHRTRRSSQYPMRVPKIPRRGFRDTPGWFLEQGACFAASCARQWNLIGEAQLRPRLNPIN